MKKSRLKLAIKKAFKTYYKAGLTNTANTVQTEILNAINKAYENK